MVGPEDVNQSSDVKIRFEIEGIWTVSELSDFLATVQRMYERMNAFLLSTSSFEELITSLSFGGPENRGLIDTTISPDTNVEAFEHLIRASNRVSSAMVVNQIIIGSPGFIEFMGALNPLKVISDFITNWRSENTVREQNRLNAELERTKIKVNLVTGVMDRAESLQRMNGDKQFLEGWIEYALDMTMEDVEAMSKDLRISGVELVEPGVRLSGDLPARSRRRR